MIGQATAAKSGLPKIADAADTDIDAICSYIQTITLSGFTTWLKGIALYAVFAYPVPA
jgi:hypothetical protein